MSWMIMIENKSRLQKKLVHSANHYSLLGVCGNCLVWKWCYCFLLVIYVLVSFQSSLCIHFWRGGMVRLYDARRFLNMFLIVYYSILNYNYPAPTISCHILHPGYFYDTAKKEGDTCSSHDQCPSGLSCHTNRCMCIGEMIDNNKYCLKSYEVLLGQECGDGQTCLHRTG
jgi:hypothetical protein